MGDLVATKSAQTVGFKERNKKGAMSATQRGNAASDASTYILIFTYWKREARVDRMRRLGKEKNEQRKKELVGVKGLFKNFATDLETSLEKGTPRVEIKPARGSGPNAA